VALAVLSMGVTTWRVRTIEITDVIMVPAAAVRDSVRSAMEGRRWGAVPRSSFVFLPLDDIEETVRTRFAFQSVNGDRRWLANTLTLHVEEQPVVADFGARARDAHVAVHDPHAVLRPSEAVDELQLAHLHGGTADVDPNLLKSRLADVQRGLPAQVGSRDGRPVGVHRSRAPGRRLSDAVTASARRPARSTLDSIVSHLRADGSHAAAVDLIVNATSLGLKDSDPLPMDDDRFPLGKARSVYDMIYRPAETKLLKAAKAAGCRTANGLGMLLYQGTKALEIWTGAPAPVEVMRQALEKNVYG